MRLQRRAQLEGARVSSEIPYPNEMPVVASILGYGDLVAGQVEGRAFPAIGGLNLQQPVGTVSIETGDIIAVTVAILHRGPADFTRQIRPARLLQPRALVRQLPLLACLAKRPVTGIARRHIAFTADLGHELRIYWWRFVTLRGDWPDFEQVFGRRPLPCRADGISNP